MRSDVAVLYVDPRGPYPALVADWYDEAKDASRYSNDLPVVAHPPCGPWGRLKAFNKHQRREHAPHALWVVRRCGGVLEHPAESSLWKHAGLPPPNGLPDVFGGWTLSVDQCRWGHVSRKQTWLYIVGCSREELPPIPPSRKAEAWVCGGRTGERPASMRKATNEEGRRTPPAFAEWLIEVASRCRRAGSTGGGEG